MTRPGIRAVYERTQYDRRAVITLGWRDYAEHATTLAMVVSRHKGRRGSGRRQDAGDCHGFPSGKDDLQRVSSAVGRRSMSPCRNSSSRLTKWGRRLWRLPTLQKSLGNIADQTSLLSLNASRLRRRAQVMQDEAFAVVATEIGQLANTSAEAVHNIEGLSARSTIWWRHCEADR